MCPCVCVCVQWALCTPLTSAHVFPCVLPVAAVVRFHTCPDPNVLSPSPSPPHSPSLLPFLSFPPPPPLPRLFCAHFDNCPFLEPKAHPHGDAPQEQSSGRSRRHRREIEGRGRGREGEEREGGRGGEILVTALVCMQTCSVPVARVSTVRRNGDLPPSPNCMFTRLGCTHDCKGRWLGEGKVRLLQCLFSTSV
jgi:hypothetical protein